MILFTVFCENILSANVQLLNAHIKYFIRNVNRTVPIIIVSLVKIFGGFVVIVNNSLAVRRNNNAL